MSGGIAAHSSRGGPRASNPGPAPTPGAGPSGAGPAPATPAPRMSDRKNGGATP